MSSYQQIEMVSLEGLVPANHVYREFLRLLDFDKMIAPIKGLEKHLGATGYGIDCLFRCLFLQISEDLSDRQLERFLQENNAAKYFCGFSLLDKTPDYSVFSKTRARIGTHRLAEIFNNVREALKNQGYMSESFSFVDASHLISKSTLWKERDKAIKEKYEKLNNETLPEVAYDKQARIGCKGKDKYWYGYKKNVSVDMRSGLINKIAITPANVTDAKALKHVCPSGSIIYGDKGYCGSHAAMIIRANNSANATIKKNNMKGKNKDQDRWRTRRRCPYERVFSQSNHRTRYRGIAKNQFTAFMEALAFNTKRLIKLKVPPLILT